MDKKLEEILAGFGEDDAKAVREAIVADTDADAEATAAAELAAAAAANDQSSSDVADEVATQVTAGIESLRSELANMVAGIAAPVAESNEEETAEIVTEILEQVMSGIDARFATIQVDAAEAVKAAEEAASAGPLSGVKPDSDATREITDNSERIQDDLDKLAKDPSLAPRMLTQALDRYAEEFGHYVPSDAPRVNVAPEHLNALQAQQLPGEAFHFDNGSLV